MNKRSGKTKQLQADNEMDSQRHRRCLTRCKSELTTFGAAGVQEEGEAGAAMLAAGWGARQSLHATTSPRLHERDDQTQRCPGDGVVWQPAPLQSSFGVSTANTKKRRKHQKAENSLRISAQFKTSFRTGGPALLETRHLFCRDTNHCSPKHRL